MVQYGEITQPLVQHRSSFLPIAVTSYKLFNVFISPDSL